MPPKYWPDARLGVVTTADSQAYTIVIDNRMPEVFVMLPHVSALEGNAGLTPVTMTVFISAARNVPTTFAITTQNGVATTADNDYVAITAQAVTIPIGQTQASFVVQFQGDINFEGDEPFVVTLNHTEGTLELAASAIATILNDDVQPKPPGPIPALPPAMLAALAILLLGASASRLRKIFSK